MKGSEIQVARSVALSFKVEQWSKGYARACGRMTWAAG
jgi:hypothetical protein